MSEREAMDGGPPQAVELRRKAEQQLHAGEAMPAEAMPERNEEVLRNAAQQWQVAFDAVGDAVFLLDADQRICRSNRAAQTLFGKSGADMEGRFCYEVVHGTAAAIPECPLLRLRDSRRREAMEMAIGDRCFSVTLDPVADATGRVSGAVHIVSDITERKRAETALKTANETLEQRVAERTEALEMLHEHLLTTAEDAQRRIAQDLHDDVGQELTGLGLKVETLAEMLAAGRSPAKKLAADIAVAVDRTRSKVRGLSRALLPPELEEGLLTGALERLAIITTTGSRIACTLDCSRRDSVFDGRLAMHLYRIAQEAVSNALRHGRAKNIRITLGQETGDTVLKIEDDGRGLPGDALQAAGMGLRSMHYRAGLIGGKLDVGPGPNGGTLVVCRLPAQKRLLET